MKTTSVYKVQETINEHGSVGQTVGYFVTSVDADKAADGRGWYGGHGRITVVHVTKIDGSYYELADPSPITIGVDFVENREKMKQTALSKLTPQERKLLGV